MTHGGFYLGMPCGPLLGLLYHEIAEGILALKALEDFVCEPIFYALFAADSGAIAQ